MPRRKKKQAVKVATPVKLTEPTSNPFPPGLERPWPSPPAIPPRVHLFARQPHSAPAGEARLISMSFVGLYAAKRWVEAIVGDEECTWPNLHTMVTASDVAVFCTPPTNKMQENGLERVLNHEYSPQEKLWYLPERHVKAIETFKRPYPDPDMPKVSKSQSRAAARAASKPDGEMISVTAIATELGLKPRDARAALRKSSFEKPDYGWQFIKDSPEHKEVAKFLEGVR